ncbi:hypothetical protein TNIN_67401 [Trichonephila inaurata madagascariensis]|uniref:Uncharacterized protein n=1 Tax=Trichonephila inaurata madagascariensis TaxID=2747483 RepID=A0A8X6YUG3_9ARAC|nr:hypothetical protein TNIN_67401 [Trichonephila inaurata madagascariensis]
MHLSGFWWNTSHHKVKHAVKDLHVTASKLLPGGHSPAGGLSNSLYHCTLPDNAVVKNSKIPRQVLLRIYGIVQEDEGVVVKEAATFMLLAERKLGPKLFGVFLMED